MIVTGQQAHKVRVQKELLAPDLDLAEHADGRQLFEVLGRGLPLGEAGADQQVEDAPGAAVAVGDGMDGLELVVRHRHAHERIDAGAVVDEAFPISELVAQQAFADRRRVDQLAAGRVDERGVTMLLMGADMSISSMLSYMFEQRVEDVDLQAPTNVCAHLHTNPRPRNAA